MRDLAGLSRPLTKLMDVIQSGCGALAKSYLIRANTKARVDEIRQIAAAISATQGLATVTYSSDEVTITPSTQPDESVQPQQIAHRALSRLAYQEARKQSNIEQIIGSAAEELNEAEAVSDEAVDPDWISRFFDAAAHVSSSEMQMLWGKILAGEVKQPGSFSLRTLDVVRTLTREEASAFGRLAALAIHSQGEPIIFNLYREYFRFDEYGLDLGALMLVEDAGLVRLTPMIKTFGTKDVPSTTVFTYRDFGVIVKKPPEVFRLDVPFLPFTKVGADLVQVVEAEPNMDYLNTFTRYLANYPPNKSIPRSEVLVGRVAARMGAEVTLENVEKVEPSQS